MLTVQVCGKTTFALDNAIKRAKQYLQKSGLTYQIKHLPNSYPSTPLIHIDVVAKTKILKAHLEDTFPQSRFSIRIKRKKIPSSPDIIKVTHDSLEQQRVSDIARLYVDSAVLVLEKFEQYV